MKSASRVAIFLMICLIISSYPKGMVKAESLATLSSEDCATLRVSLPQGTMVGTNTDPWLNEGWILYFTSAQWTFTVRVNETSASKKSYDTRLVIALNDPAYTNLVSLSVNGIPVSKTSFKYGIPKPYNLMTWPSGDVYPTWYDDTSINLGTINSKSYKNAQVCVTFSNPTDARMHFDAYGKRTWSKPKSVGDVTWSANSEDSTVLYQGPPPPTYTFTISATSGGTTDPVPGSYPYTAGTEVSVTALPSPYYFFDHWVLDGSPAGSENPINVTMDSDHTLQAVFAHISYTLTITATSGGTTDPSPGSYTHDAGTYASVRALPDPYYSFDHWMLDGANAGSANPIDVFMDGDHTLNAVFVHITFTLTISASSGGTTNPSPGTHGYDAGTTVPVTAVPDPYNQLDHWVLDGSNAGSANPISVTMDKDHALLAVFAPVTYTLTITATAGGTTDPSPGSYVHNGGTHVLVEALPDPYFSLDHWELDGVNVGSTNPIDVLMDKDHTLNAVFTSITYTLTITATSGGTTDPSLGTHTYSGGAVVQVEALPDLYYFLDHWELDGINVGSDNSISVTMDKDHTLHAVFAHITYTLTITATSGGTTDPIPNSYVHDAGSTVSVTALPDTHYRFDHWEFDGVPAGSDNPINVFMDKDHALHAVFKPITYTLTIIVSAGGTTDPAPGAHVYNAGTPVSVLAIPDLYYRFDHWELDGVPVGSENPISLTLNPDHTLLAVFVHVTYTLSISVTAGGTTDPSPGPHVYDAGSTASVTAIPDADYRLDHWELDGVPAGSANPISVFMDKDHTLKAFFVLRTYTLTVSTMFGGTTDPVPNVYIHNAGSTISATAIPDADHLFDHWVLDGVNAGSANPIEVLMDKDHTLQAVFVVKPELASTSHVAHEFGEVFYINVEITGASNLYGFEFKMRYNTTLLDALDVSEGSFLKGFGATSITALEIHDAEGYVLFGVTLLSPSPPAQGDGVLATITFSVTYATEWPETLGCILDLYDTKLFDPLSQLIPHNVVDGFYEFVPIQPVCIGPSIDVYTQKPDPFSGKGQNKRSDAFGPQEEVILYASVHYNCEPVEYKLVGFEIIDPHGTTRDYRTAYSDENGIATTTYRIPWEGSNAEDLFGDWTVIGTVDIAGTTVNDTLIFRFGWLIEILSVETCDILGVPKTTFVKGEEMYFKVNLKNIAFTPKTTTLTVLVCDECNVPIGKVTVLDWSIPAGETEMFTIGLQIPQWAFTGAGTVFANAYTLPPQLGGTAYCPEISTNFIITKP